MRLGPYLIGLLLSVPAWSLEPDLTLRQINHRSWTAASGAPSYVEALTQTADGALWLGSLTGLFRFDGVRFERYTGPDGRQAFASINISTLNSWPDTGLWIGFRFGGVAVINGNRLTNYTKADGLPRGTVKCIVRGRDGEMWVATHSGLARLRGTRWERVPIRPDLDSEGIMAAFVDARGTLWVLTTTHLVALPRHSNTFTEMTSIPDAATRTQNMPLAGASDGTLWVSAPQGGVLRLTPPFAPKPGLTPLFPGLRPGTLLLDREGSLWVGSDRLQRLAAQRLEAPADEAQAAAGQRLESFAQSDGLSGIPNTFFEDREGNIWVGTSGGLDQFSHSNLVRISLPAGTESLPRGESPALAAGTGGAIWVAYTRDSSGGEVAQILGNALSPPLYKEEFTCAYRDPDGSIWFGGTRGLIHLEGTQRSSIPLPEEVRGAEVQAISRDPDGSLWISAVGAGAFRFAAGKWTEYGDLPGLPRSPAIVITTDEHGIVWFGYTNNRVARVAGSSVAVLTAADGLAVGHVTSIQGRGSDVWIGGELGLAHFDGAHVATLLGPTDDAFTGISGIIATSNGDLWLNGGTGISHIRRAEWEQALRDPTYRLHLELFNYLDGLRAPATQLRPTPSALQGTDGRLWFAHLAGVVSIDPAHIRRNPLPPPVSIWSVSSGAQRYYPQGSGAALRLPARTTSLQIQFGAGSLSVPERVHFRYKLAGSDEDWQDAGNRREAFYTNLAPGHYAFRVIAANNDGVWNYTGAALELLITPTFYQTGWFYALCASACVALLYALHRLRLKQARARVRARLQERVTERERIARELHDTLLQGIQGLILRFHAIAERFAPRESIREQMERALVRAEEALTEGRNRVRELRAEGEAIELSQAIAARGEQLAQEHSVSFRANVEGIQRELHPIVREEALLIAGEALNNAFRHAQAHNIEAEVSFAFAELHVRIRDDGRGIDPAFLGAKGRRGHWGLAGMRERAGKLRASLSIWSKPDAGTEVDLCVPADVAYRIRERESLNRWRSWLLGTEQ